MFQSVNPGKKPATGLHRNNNNDELAPSKQVNIRPPFLKSPIQKAAEEEEKVQQAKPDTAAQLAATKEEEKEEIQAKTDPAQNTENKTGMPDNLKSGVEQLSGFDMSDVRVFYNSPKPAAVQAHAYTQGSDIHVAPRQEKYLPHEVWHAAQQKQGRVQPTSSVNGMPVNDNAGLENEADVMGDKAQKHTLPGGVNNNFKNPLQVLQLQQTVVQRQRASSYWLLGAFNDNKHGQSYKNVTELRTQFGEDAFRYLLGLETSDLEPITSFFRKQKYPIENIIKQSDFLIPKVGNQAKLELAEDALETKTYDVDQATLLFDYLSKYQDEGETVLNIAKNKLTEKDNDYALADKTMEETKPYNYLESVKNKVEELAGKKAELETQSALDKNQTDKDSFITEYEKYKPFKEDWTKDTIKLAPTELVNSLFKNEVTLNINGNSQKQKSRKALNKARDKKLEEFQSKENEIKSKLPELKIAKQTEINNIITPLYRHADNEKAINQCLEKAGDNNDDLENYVSWIDAGITNETTTLTVLEIVDKSTLIKLDSLLKAGHENKASVIKLIKEVGANKESELEVILKKIDKNSTAELIQLLQIATLPTLTQLLNQANGNTALIENFLITKAFNITDITTLLGDEKSKDITVSLLETFINIDTKKTIELTGFAPNKETLENFLKEIKGKGNAISAIETELGSGTVTWDTILALPDVKKARGLTTDAGVTIPELDVSTLKKEEAKAVNATLNYILGTSQKPILTHPNSAKFGDPWNNTEGRLPGSPGAGGYEEYYVEKDPGASDYHGSRRILKHIATGYIYYSNNHYALGSFSRIY